MFCRVSSNTATHQVQIIRLQYPKYMVRKMSICGIQEHSNQMFICRIRQWVTYLTAHQIHGGGNSLYGTPRNSMMWESHRLPCGGKRVEVRYLTLLPPYLSPQIKDVHILSVGKIIPIDCNLGSFFPMWTRITFLIQPLEW